MILLFAELLPVFTRGDGHFLLEDPVEECGVGIADDIGDLRDGLVGLFQQLAGFFEAYLLQIIAEGHACILGKDDADVGKAEIDVFTDLRKRQRLCVIVDNIVFDITGNVLPAVICNFVADQINECAGEVGAQDLRILPVMLVVFIQHLLHQEQDLFVIVVVDVLGRLVFKFVVVEGDQILVDHVAELMRMNQRIVQKRRQEHTVDDRKFLSA